MSIPLFQIDAFTARPFAGNPAGVCLLTAPAEESWMQRVAAEMNLAETAFLWPESNAFRLRWFTPIVEVDLCGHATLASAHVLWEAGRLPPDAAARFQTRSGLLTARRDNGWIELDFPSTPVEPSSDFDGLPAALGVTARYIGRSRFDALVEVAGEDVVRGLKPDLASIAKLPVRGVMVTSASDEAGVDFVSRFFGPAAGVDEDPVTGSAHCALAPYWHERTGRTSFVARQVSARGGELRVALDGDRVRLAGQAVTIFRADLLA